MATTMASTTTSSNRSCTSTNNSGNQQTTAVNAVNGGKDDIPSNLMKFDVVIVGSGVAGVSAAYHLHQLSSSSSSLSSSGNSSKGLLPSNWLLVDSATNAGTGNKPRHSGSATMSTAGCVKMMVQLFAGSCEQFISHHGRIGAKRYLKATQRGLEIQKQIAKDVLLPIVIQHTENRQQQQRQQKEDSTDEAAASADKGDSNNNNRKEKKWKNTFINELGSYYVAYEKDEATLRKEFETLRSLMQEEEENDDNNKDGAKPTPRGNDGNTIATTATAMVEWCDKERLSNVEGMSDKFHCGIYFPKDAIIDSSLYAKTLSAYLLLHKLFAKEGKSSKGQFWPNTTVVDVKERYHYLNKSSPSNKDDDECYYAMVTMKLEQQQRTIQVLAKHVVMATGGIYKDPNLHGLIKPCYSYLVHVPVQKVDEEDNNISKDTKKSDNEKGEEEMQEEDGNKKGSNNNSDSSLIDCSPNFFTWGYTHDWCFVNGKIRCSGEDHFSAYKDSKYKERCYNLSKWTMEQYGCNTNNKDQAFWDNIPQQYGIYSETPDMVPLIGHFKSTRGGRSSSTNTATNGTESTNSTGRICYLLGCNAWGQTILSYCASLIPGLLGYKELSKEQRDILKLVSIQRFSSYRPTPSIPSLQVAAAGVVPHHQTIPPPTQQQSETATQPLAPTQTSIATTKVPPQQPVSSKPIAHHRTQNKHAPSAPSNNVAAAPIPQPPLPPGPPQVPPVPAYGVPTAAYVVPVTYAMPYGMPPQPIYHQPQYTAMPMAYQIPPPLPPPTPTSSAAAAAAAARAASVGAPPPTMPATRSAAPAPVPQPAAPPPARVQAATEGRASASAPARRKKRAKQVCSKCFNPACRRPFAHGECTTGDY